MSKILSSLTAAVLVTVYNNLATTIDVADVKRFANKDKAIERITALLAQVNKSRAKESLPLIDIAEDGKLVSVETAKSESQGTEKQAAAPATRKKSPGRAPAVSASDIIILVVTENPKRAEAAARFSKYETGIKVGDYFERVGDTKQGLRDINWDLKKGWIKVVGAKSAAAKAALAKAAEPTTAPEAEASEGAEPAAPAAHEVPAAPVAGEGATA